MGYVQWLKWRKDTGSRPLLKRDKRFTTSEEEVALWRSVIMEFLHDMPEGEEEEDDDEEEEGEEELPPSLEPVEGDEGPELIPAEGNGSAEAAVPARARLPP